MRRNQQAVQDMPDGACQSGYRKAVQAQVLLLLQSFIRNGTLTYLLFSAILENHSSTASSPAALTADSTRPFSADCICPR